MMSETITKLRVWIALDALNRRMESRGSVWRYEVGWRYGYTALDPVRDGGVWGDSLICGTKREVWEYMRAMMRALDDSAELATSPEGVDST